jgi:tetratricopeptide (TPR) repeat protein
MYETFQSGRYKVLKKLGAGGMGAIYEAQDTRLNQTVALKVIKNQEQDEESLARFKREGQTMKMLSHPNIVSILDTGQEDDTHFIVMEFVAGRSLQDFMDSHHDRRIDMTLALNIAKQISQALQHAHSQDILHRDIKPSNIMIDTDQRAKLTDFGIAKGLGLSTLTHTGDVIGTAAYMAPEQALGEVVDVRTDLYALGCVLFEMVAGQRLFPGDNAARLLFSHVNDIPSLPRRVAVEISPALEEIIFKLLAKDPDQRYQSADELLESIANTEAQADPHVVAVQTAERRWGLVLVGRDDELALLRKRCDATLRYEGRLVFLTGEAGIGKSRLAHQLEVYAGMRNVRFFTGRARHIKERTPYKPWIDVLRSVVRSTSSSALAKLVGNCASDLMKLVPELADKLKEIPDSPAASPEQQRDRLFNAVAFLIRNLSQNVPLAIFLDDLQWADRATLQLLEHVALQTRSEPVLLIGAFRKDELESRRSLEQIVAELNRERISETVQLKRLNAEQSAEKIRKTFGGQELPELEALIYEKTEGNPFFIEELLRSLLAAEHIILAEGIWKVEDLTEVHVPSGIRAVVQERLARLSEESRSMLSMASIIGREFSFTTLQAVVETDEDSLLEMIDEALQAQILLGRRVPGEEVYAFTDVPVKDVLYERISTVRRIRHHLRIGESIERICADKLDEHVGALAHHFLAGNDVLKAAHYSERAGDEAARVFAWYEATGHYETTLKLIGAEDTVKRAELLHKLAIVTGSMLIDPEMSLSYANSALELYEQLGDKRHVVEMHMLLQLLYHGGFGDGTREDKALKHLEAAVAIAEEFPESVEQGLLYQRMAHMHLHRGEPAITLDFAQMAFDLFAKLRVPMGTALGTALAYTGQLDEGVAHSEGNWEIVRKLGNPLATSAFGHELALTLALARDIPRARAWGEKVFPEVADASIVYEGLLRRPLVLIYTLSGEVDKATEMCQAEEAIEQKTLAGCYFEDVAGIGLHYLRQGERDRARAYLERALTAHQERNTVAAVGANSFVLGCLGMEEGNYDEAEELLLRSLQICRNGGNVLFELWVLPVLAELYLKMGQPEKTVESIERGFELLIPDRNWYGLPGPLHTAKGMLASTRRNRVEAEESFSKAVAINRQYELPWDEAKTLYEWGIMYGQKRDKESAYKKLDKAIVLFRNVSAKNDIEKTEAAKERLGTSWISRIRKRIK